MYIFAIVPFVLYCIGTILIVFLSMFMLRFAPSLSCPVFVRVPFCMYVLCIPSYITQLLLHTHISIVTIYSPSCLYFSLCSSY